jgi:4-hydroxy-tetrahydrodipicolinate synthase
MQSKKQIKGLWVPLVTPFYEGEIDKQSLVCLTKEIEPYVDGFVPCLSSGEGQKLSRLQWESVVEIVRNATAKPVAAGILRDSIDEIIAMIHAASDRGCATVVVAIQGKTREEQKAFCDQLSHGSALPVILYNTERAPVTDAETMIEIAKLENIIAIKDSSERDAFFASLLHLKKEAGVEISILQGMENKLLISQGCDGYLIALANVEPALSGEMFLHPTAALNATVMEKWREYDLASEEWYASMKRALAARGIIRSAALVS